MTETSVAGKLVYKFREGNKSMKALLGGKGANLAEMTTIGLPVPPGFTITTEVCNLYSGTCQYPDGLTEQVDEALADLETRHRQALRRSPPTRCSSACAPAPAPACPA